MAKAVESRLVTGGQSVETVLKVLQVTPQLVTLQYELLPDTNPGANGNFVAMWQNTNNIPYNLPPEASQKIEGSTQRGQFSFKVELTRNNYIIGYSVGPELASPSQKYGNICSTVYIPIAQTQHSRKEGESLSADPYATFFSNLTLGIVTSDGVTFKYEVPTNNRPATNKAWVGLFRGSANYSNPPEKGVPITSDEDSGWLAINRKIVFDREYTLALFMSGWSDTTPVQTRMAATISFVG